MTCSPLPVAFLLPAPSLSLGGSLFPPVLSAGCPGHCLPNPGPLRMSSSVPVHTERQSLMGPCPLTAACGEMLAKPGLCTAVTPGEADSTRAWMTKSQRASPSCLSCGANSSNTTKSPLAENPDTDSPFSPSPCLLPTVKSQAPGV